MNKAMLQSDVCSVKPWKEESPFSKMCSLILMDLLHKRTVRERTILDFARHVAKVFSYDVILDLPISFFNLAESIDDYLKYDSEEDKDTKRCVSYARVFQMTQLITIWVEERKRENALQEDVERNRKNITLFEIVYNSPWITHKELAKMLGISAPALTQRVGPIEASGYLSSQRLGQRKHYFLTDIGISLYRKISPQTKQLDEAPNWSIARTRLLMEFLSYYLSSFEDVRDVPVSHIYKKTCKFTEDQVSFVLKLCKKNYSADINNIAVMRELQRTPQRKIQKRKTSEDFSNGGYFNLKRGREDKVEAFEMPPKSVRPKEFVPVGRENLSNSSSLYI